MSKKKTTNNNTLSEYAKTNQSFSGCDMVASIDLRLPSGSRLSCVLGQVQTLNYSTFMDKKPVRALGNVNAKDYTYGPRTIAGSIIFTVFNKHWLHELIEKYGNADEINYEYLVDELPPFNITITAQNEYGYASRLAIYGVRLLSEGEVLSINDVYTENTYQFVATGLDYLKATNTPISGGSQQSLIAGKEKAVSNAMKESTKIAIPVNNSSGNANTATKVITVNGKTITITTTVS